MTIQNTSFSAVFQSITFLCKILIAGMILVFFSVQTSLPADITLAWDPNTEADLAAYKIYYKTGASGAPYEGTGADQGDSGFRVPLESLAQQGSPTYTLTGLPDATYYFVVTAVDSEGYESGYSNEVVWEAGSTASTYTITSSSGSNGSITPAGSTTLAEGENQTYTITPDPNYRIKEVRVDGASVGPVAEYSFSNVRSGHTISASFEIHTFMVPRAITASSAPNGSISPEGLVNVASGSDMTFDITPNANYHIQNVLVDGASVGPVSNYAFTNITTDHTITATFDINTYAITSSAGLHGSISPSANVPVAYGGSQTFTIIPDAGYGIGQITVDGAVVAPANRYSFTNVTSNHSISVNFVPSPYTITASCGSNGSISPVGSVSVEPGSNHVFTISADPNYFISDVQVDGVSVGAVASYAFANVAGSHSISALFDMENQAPIADAGPDQQVESSAVVTLIGSNSIDLDDGIASFVWEQVSGPTVALSNPEDLDTAFVAPEVGQNGESLTFQLTVTDNGGQQSTDTCIVNVIWVNTPPVSSAGMDQTVDEETIVRLDGSKSSDADDGIASYLWQQVGGITVNLSDPSAVQPSFTAPDVRVNGSTLSFQLTVTDHGGLQSADTCIVNVTRENIPPISDAGTDQTVDEGATVMLNGSKSFDADDGIGMYLWKQLSGIPVTLSDSTAIQPYFTAPQGITEPLEFRLKVIDNGGLESSDTCVVAINSCDMDVDNDGYTDAACGGPDCNDSDPNINPGSPEDCGDGVDNNCDGSIDEGCPTCTDADGDGYCQESEDCNDANASVNPGASEFCGDGEDNNCNGVADEDCSSYLPIGSYCSSNSECSSGKCRWNWWYWRRTCR